jgi:hypothetical protein
MQQRQQSVNILCSSELGLTKFILIVQMSHSSTSRPGITEEEIEELRQAFNLFDTDGNGKFFQNGQRRVINRLFLRCSILFPATVPRLKIDAMYAFSY